MDAITAALYAQFHNPWHCMLRINAATNLTATGTIPFDTVVYDGTGSSMGTTGASAKITIPVNGIYLVGTSLGWGTGGADVAANITINTTAWGQVETQAGTGHNGGLMISFPYMATAGDTIQTVTTFLSNNPTGLSTPNACLLYAVFMAPV